jgi:hypothetical protein
VILGEIIKIHLKFHLHLSACERSCLSWGYARRSRAAAPQARQSCSPHLTIRPIGQSLGLPSGGEQHRCRLSCPLYQCSELRREEYSSCILCRSRKIRCDRGTPCSNCLKSRNGTCVYGNSPSHSPHQQHHLAQEPGASQYPTPSSNISRGSIAPSHPSSTSVTSSTNASTRANQPLSRDIDFLESIDRQAED